MSELEDMCVFWNIYDYSVKFDIFYYYEDPSQSVISGSIKWDGCSNWHADPLHTCEREGLEKVTKAMLWCWDFTRDNCPKFDKS